MLKEKTHHYLSAAQKSGFACSGQQEAKARRPNAECCGMDELTLTRLPMSIQSAAISSLNALVANSTFYIYCARAAGLLNLAGWQDVGLAWGRGSIGTVPFTLYTRTLGQDTLYQVRSRVVYSYT